jgi:phosphatidylglycerol:prolipoprotein diacylglycerol transferase
MIPVLFKIGPFSVYSYGLMLGIAFITANYIFSKELERRKINPNIATEITFLAIIFGIIGAKGLHLIENWNTFILNPLSEAFSPGGLTFYGGLILAAIAIFIYVRKKKIPFLAIADMVAPSLALAYGIGRIGCHLAGDGDYGIPTSLPWGVNYENGTVPPSFAFRGSEIAAQFPNGIVPDNTPLHPTPIYEFLSMAIIAFILWRLLKKDWPNGKIFSLYLILTAFSRLMVEFIRLNPRLLFGLSEAQLISIVLIVLGTAGFIYLQMNPQLPRFNFPKHEAPQEKKKPLAK